jgi:hypothetical protein
LVELILVVSTSHQVRGGRSLENALARNEKSLPKGEKSQFRQGLWPD